MSDRVTRMEEARMIVCAGLILAVSRNVPREAAEDRRIVIGPTARERVTESGPATLVVQVAGPF